MSGPDQYAPLLASIRAEWNKAEKDIKIAEQVCNKVVWPSIKELRYAGRRVVEALDQIHNGGPEAEVNRLLNDALFDCLRARHDAIDATMSKISSDLDIAVEKLKYKNILPVFPEFPNLLKRLTNLQNHISRSRGERHDRELIYETLEAENFPALVSSFRDFRSSEGIMASMAKQDRRERVINYAIGIIGVVSLITTFIVALN